VNLATTTQIRGLGTKAEHVIQRAATIAEMGRGSEETRALDSDALRKD